MKNQTNTHATHTHGPWYFCYEPDRALRVAASDGNSSPITIAKIAISDEHARISPSHAEANARLISAAPQLLRAALYAIDIMQQADKLIDDERAVHAIEGENKCAHECALAQNNLKSAIADARDAVAKAIGIE